ncbi:MAG: extracellular solute-binding protein [Candidatus Kaiserbacteria bacterium]|nr:extracellular solute-binding protein [Candidatus Kaiserbacteria bacterium]
MNKQNFQIIIYVIFGLLILVGFGSLALYGFLKKNEQSSSQGKGSQERERIEIVVWGTLGSDKANTIFKNLHGSADKGYSTVQYREKNTDSLEDEFARAVAYDEWVPDLLLLEASEVLALEHTALRTIPFGYDPVTTAAEYQNLFTPTTHLFLRSDGYIALPVLADSVVLYYNEGLRRQQNLRQLPKVWKDFTEKEYQEIASEYRKNDKAIAPFGAYGNYTNAPYLFTALMLQAQEFGTAAPSTADLISFYTNFASLRSPVQTWSESFLNARSMFIGNQLLFYPGFISEYQGLQQANPNIVIQAAPLPQLSADSTIVTPTKIYALAIPEKGRHVGPAHRVLFDAATVIQQIATDIFKATTMPPPLNSLNRESGAETEEGEAFFNTITATEQVFLDTLFTGRSVSLTPETKTTIRDTLKSVIIGTHTADQGARTMQNLFE